MAYGAVNVPGVTGAELEAVRKIAQAAKEQLNMELDKKKLVLPNPIKTVGTTSVSVKLHPQVTAELKVVVKEA